MKEKIRTAILVLLLFILIGVVIWQKNQSNNSLSVYIIKNNGDLCREYIA